MVTDQITEKWKRIEGWVRKADKFLFGLVPGNQNQKYRYLAKEKGFLDEWENQYRGPYTDVLDSILRNQGIERLVSEVIIDLALCEFNYPYHNGKSSLDIIGELWAQPKSEPPKGENILNVDEDKKEITFNIVDEEEGKKEKVTIIYASSKNYYIEKNIKSQGNCTLLDITKVGEKYVVKFSEFCKLWYAELAEIEKDHGYFTKKSQTEAITRIDSSKKYLDVIPAKIAMPDIDVTNRFFKILEAVPYDLSNESYKQMLTKILAITSISKMPETRPLYEQLSKIIDFGHMMSLIE
ncbi:MAG: hypothetical protein PHQ10_04620 [Dehalococcoidales bacterium]|jgi:glucan-binding YG repeat protein|nr:hypothetical protein [Dehalococcoidales bacterium]MDD5498679.1 hypothetical protein [Dehalococcoidales bacterium]